MKRIFLFLLCFVLFNITHAQTAAQYQWRLYKVCKVWGYMKYFHSEVSNCRVSWDSTLLATLPQVKACANEQAFDSVLYRMMQVAGDMEQPIMPVNAITPGHDKNLDLTWFHKLGFSSQVVGLLDTIKSRFRPHTGCYVKRGSNSYLLFDDSAVIANAVFPSETAQLVVAFKYWNIIRYFNPNNDLMDQPWDSTLMQFTLRFANAATLQDYYLTLMEFVARIDDTHASQTGNSYLTTNFFGAYYPGFKVTYIENQTVVTNIKAGSLVSVGDIIKSINGKSCDSIRMSLKKYTCASNPSALQRDLNIKMLAGPLNSTMTLELETPAGMKTVTQTRNLSLSTYYTPVYDISKKNPLAMVIQPQNVGYINMAHVTGDALLDGMYDDSLRSKPSLILDFRNYPSISVPYSNFFDNISDQDRVFVKLTIPSVTYPGVLDGVNSNMFGNGAGSKKYTGQIFVLVNEETQSAAEYSTMALQSMPNVKVVGSQTAGADGNISRLRLPGSFFSYFSTLKVLYPDDHAAQRNGIRLDRTVKRTINGVRNGADEILEAALSAATELGEKGSGDLISIYPNPATDRITIDFGEGLKYDATISLTDITGKTIAEDKVTAGCSSFVKHISGHSEGIYLLNIVSAQRSITRKILVRRN